MDAIRKGLKIFHEEGIGAFVRKASSRVLKASSYALRNLRILYLPKEGK